MMIKKDGQSEQQINQIAAQTGVFHLKGEGEPVHLKAGTLMLKVSGKETKGSTAVWEDVVLPNDGPPLHIHHLCDELFYVVEGEFTFQVDNLLHTGTAGAFIFIPKGMVHTYLNSGKQPGRLLGFVTPAGLEEFYQAQAEVPPEEMTPSLYASIGQKHDMDVIGPKIGASE